VYFFPNKLTAVETNVPATHKQSIMLPIPAVIMESEKNTDETKNPKTKKGIDKVISNTMLTMFIVLTPWILNKCLFLGVEY
jgi:hypothetical protein